MPEVSVDVAGRSYRLSCGEGEEAHLMRLAEMIDAEAQRLHRKIGQMTEGRLMLMSALMLADKLVEAEAAKRDAEQRAVASAKVAQAQAERGTLSPEREEEIATNLDALAARIEMLAGRVEQPA